MSPSKTKNSKIIINKTECFVWKREKIERQRTVSALAEVTAVQVKKVEER